MTVTVTGLEEATAEIARVQKGMAQMEGTRIFIGTKLPYGYGIEFGVRQLSGHVARYAGGAYMISGAADDVLSDGDRDITGGLKVVRSPGPWILRRLALWVRRLARAQTPRVSGRLAKSIRMFTERGL